METKTILGNRGHKKTNFRFWGTVEEANLSQGNMGADTPSPLEGSYPTFVTASS